MMKDIVQPLLDTVLRLIQPQQGTKFLVTVAGLGALVFLAMKGLLTPELTWAVPIVIGLYYVSDLLAKTFCKPEEPCECEDEPEEEIEA